MKTTANAVRVFNEASDGPTHLSKGKRRRQEILDVAYALFVREGFAAFSARGVASEVGMTLGNLQHYFLTRDDLLREMVKATFAAFNNRYNALIVEPQLDRATKFDAVIDSILTDVHDKRVCAFILKVFAIGQNDAAIGALVEESYETYREMLAKLFKQMSPELSKSQAKDLATLFASQLDGLMFFTFRGGIVKKQEWPRLANTAKKLWRAVLVAR